MLAALLAMESICDDATTSRPSRIPVVVVESHQHVLEHIHAFLRHRARIHSRKVRRRQHGSMVSSDHQTSAPSLPPPIAMVHFDSHPDLACPSTCVPARACFEPRRDWPVRGVGINSNEGTSTQQETSEEMRRNLYEHLDLDRSGIAQWILPLVLSGDINNLHWIRSAWADQIADGQYCYNVGAWVPPEDERKLPKMVTKFVDLPEDAIMKVDLNHKYYLEDDSTVPTHELVLPKALRLYVSELQSTNNEDIENDLEQQEWILDICLDYFLCRNPFIDEIVDIDAEFAAAFVAIVEQAKFNPLQYQQEYERFQKCMAGILRSLLDRPVSTNGSDCSFYESCGAEESLLRRLAKAAFNCSDEDRSKLIQLAIDALPSVTLPHDTYMDDEEALKCATTQIEAMEAYLHGVRASSSLHRFTPEPMMITVARSTDDGFTPKAMVDILQQRTLAMVHRVYCSGSCGRNEMFGDVSSSSPPTPSQYCRLNVVYDYGEWEGSELDLGLWRK